MRSQVNHSLVSPFRWLARLAIRRPWRVIFIAALLTLAAAPGIFRLKLRTDGHALVSPTAPEVVSDEQIRAHFGIRDQIVVLVRPATNDVFNPPTLQLVRDLTAEFKKIPGVGAADVVSLATEPSFRLRPGTLIHQTLLEPPLQTPAELDQLRDDVRRIELYTGTFISADGKATVILVGVPEEVERAEFHRDVRRIADAKNSADHEIALTGAPVAESLFGVQILEDLGVPRALLGASRNENRGWQMGNHSAAGGESILDPPSSIVSRARGFIAHRIGLVPLAALVMMLVLLVCFRNILAALLPLPGVAATMVFVFGLMGWLGVPIYLTTAVMPVLLTVISVTNDIYLFSRYFTLLRERADASHVALVAETFDKLTRPVVCTSFAAVIGFLSFAFSPLAPVRAFGLFTGVGALFGLFLSLTVVPALLVLVNPKWFRRQEKNIQHPTSNIQHPMMPVGRVAPRGPARGKSDAARAERRAPPIEAISRLGAGFARIGDFVHRRRSLVISLTLVVIALTPLGLRRLVVQDSWTNGFAPESEFRRVTEAVNENFFGMHLLFTCADAPKTVRGEIASSAISGLDAALPATAVEDAMLMAGSPITLIAGEAVWQSHIEMVNRNGDIIYARLARTESMENFRTALAKAGRAQFEIRLRTHFAPNVIHALGDFENFIRAQKQDAVGGALGPEDYLVTTRFMARPTDPDARRLPDNAAEMKVMWDYYNIALGPQRLRQLVDTNYSESLTTIFLKDANFKGTAHLMKSLRDYEKTNLTPMGITISFAGDVAVSQSLIRGIVSTQLQSLFWSLLGIFAVTAAFGGAWRWGFLCLLPSFLAVVIKFAVMGWADIPLGVATSMFAAMTLGIGVNCAIHLLEGFDHAHAAGLAPSEALTQTLRLTGPPAFINTLAMSLGFGVLMLSQVPANARLGILLVLGLVNCFVVSMLLLPALLRKKT